MKATELKRIADAQAAFLKDFDAEKQLTAEEVTARGALRVSLRTLNEAAAAAEKAEKADKTAKPEAKN